MDLLQAIIDCKDEEVDELITKAIEEANSNAEHPGELGFVGTGHLSPAFKGFIPLDTRIKYANLNIETYGMGSTDYFYDFAHFIKKANIKGKGSLIMYMEYFINYYFGYPGKVDRETIFNDRAFQTTTTDEEYFQALENNKLGDLKGTGAAECTERAALAQQLLSLFGTESYYCMGCCNRDGKEEAHAFNVVKRVNDYALLDYSIPVASFNQDKQVTMYYPFVGQLTNEEYEAFLANGEIKNFDNYDMEGKTMVKNGGSRKYVVGSFTISKENDTNKTL